MNINRRCFLASASALSGGVWARSIPAADDDDVAASRSHAMLIGSLVGDALGGPIEFKPPEQVRSIMPDARSWESDQVIDDQVKKRLAHSLQMYSYAELRPEPAAYGPWKAKAERGTITDDSRHKIVLMRGLRRMLAESRDQFTTQDVARQFLNFRPHEQQDLDPELAALVNEGLQEYRYASRWVLGQRDPANALPVERLWSGIANCSGQMMMTPLAALFPGEPEKAYRETFRLDFIDAPIARDIASAINAGLAAALDPQLDHASTEQRWQSLVGAMRNTDPYRLGDVPFAGRPLHRWLDLADSIAQRSGGRPSKIYELLEKEGKPVYYWDAHFTLLVALTMLKACDFDPMSAMHLTLDFGHDTDSYAQLLGAMAGAVHGMDIFPITMCTAVETRLAADYGESVHDWVRTLTAAAKDWTIAPGI